AMAGTPTRQACCYEPLTLDHAAEPLPPAAGGDDGGIRESVAVAVPRGDPDGAVPRPLEGGEHLLLHFPRVRVAEPEEAPSLLSRLLADQRRRQRTGRARNARDTGGRSAVTAGRRLADVRHGDREVLLDGQPARVGAADPDAVRGAGLEVEAG